MQYNKSKSCAGCPDRTIEPVNCHMTCREYLYRQKENEEKKKKRAADKVFDNFKKEVVRETKVKINRKKG